MAIAIPGCNRSTTNSELSIPSDTTALVKQCYKEARWRLPDEAERSYAYLFDRPTFLKKHRDEMLRTLEIVESSSIGPLTAVFTRYSVGTSIYREVVWLNKLEGENRISVTQYFSEYSTTVGIDWKSEQGKALLNKTKEWVKDSKEWPL